MRREYASGRRKQQQRNSEDSADVRPLTFPQIAGKSLLAADLGLSKYLAISAEEGRLRPIMKLLEISCHGIPWIFGALYILYKASNYDTEEVFFNLLLALFLDLAIVGAIKVTARRPRPKYNKNDMFVTVSIDNFSFPSGHATRAYMVTWFILNHVKLAIPVRFLLVIWSNVVGLSRVMLGRHHISDVLAGFVIGYAEFLLVEQIWIPRTQCSAFINLIK